LQPLFKTDAITPTDCIQLFVVAKTLVAIGSKSSSANKICTNETYKLEPLKVYVYWDVIKKFGGFEDKSSKEEMEKIGLDISKQCGGMALAAQALGYMLVKRLARVVRNEQQGYLV
jgi:hypothetical protein